MRYSAYLLSLATLIALVVPTLEITAKASQSPEFFEETKGQGRYQLAISETKTEEERQAEADLLLLRGAEQYRIRQLQEALQSWERALEIYREVKDLQGEARALGNLGIVASNLGRYQQAIELYEQSLAIKRGLGDLEGQGVTLENLGDVYYHLEDYELAIDIYERSLAIANETEDISRALRILASLGESCRRIGEYQKSIAFFEQGLIISRDKKSQSSEANFLTGLGLAYVDIGQYETAIIFHEQSLSIARSIDHKSAEAYALANLASANDALGQYGLAIYLYEQSIEILQNLDEQAAMGRVLGDMGDSYHNLGQYQRAIGIYESSLEILDLFGDKQGQGIVLHSLGNSYLSLGNYGQAEYLYGQSLMVARDISSAPMLANALGSLGNVFEIRSEYEQAISLYQQQLEIAIEVGDRTSEGIALGKLAIIHHQLGNHQQAIKLFEQRLAIAREIKHHEREALGLNNLGAVFLALGDFSRAESVFRQSIEIYESLRENLLDDQLIAFADTQARTYANLELTLTAQNKIEEALAITERGRGRAFVLQFASRLATEEERAALEASPMAQVPTVVEIQQIARETNTTLVTYSLIFDQALYIWVVQPTGEIEFREMVFDGSAEGGAIINPIAAIDGPVYRSAAPDSEVSDLVAGLRATVVVESTGAVNHEQLQELHKMLIDPIADLLPSDPNSQVAFIPQGELFLVPFAALQDDDGTYLIEKHTILTAPSIQVFGLASREGSLRLRSESEDHRFLSGVVGAAAPEGLGKNALVVGNPTMPTVWLPTDDGFTETQLSYLSGAETEAKAIGDFFDIPVLTGEQATEARIKQELPNASLIHLATHGLLDYGIPESSGVLDVPGAVALAPGNGEDGLLTSAEILQMDLQADLAILSACDTGRGRITGDGVVGLSRALITAGVPSVIVSLWAVNDDSTSILMQRFYQFLATGEFTKAEALRQAQLSLLYAEDVETRLEAVRASAVPTSREGFEPVGDRHPYHWAPFVLIGNGL
ncbi:MAG: CHAT domain-containing protein [Leptolyngbya sp. SIOISBB]|nr:CHAT domain-containing protein [Leptolyngbya sp. SIOISBB]